MKSFSEESIEYGKETKKNCVQIAYFSNSMNQHAELKWLLALNINSPYILLIKDFVIVVIRTTGEYTMHGFARKKNAWNKTNKQTNLQHNYVSRSCAVYKKGLKIVFHMFPFINILIARHYEIDLKVITSVHDLFFGLLLLLILHVRLWKMNHLKYLNDKSLIYSCLCYYLSIKLNIHSLCLIFRCIEIIKIC